MAKGHAREAVLIGHFIRSPKMPANYHDLSRADQKKANDVYDRKYVWWVTWYEYLLAIDRAPDAPPDVNRASNHRRSIG